MTLVITLLVGVALLALLVRHFLRTPPADLVRQLYLTGGMALMATGVGLLFVRQFAIALPVGMAGLMLFRRHRAMRTHRRQRVRHRVCGRRASR